MNESVIKAGPTWCALSLRRVLATPWSVAGQAPLSIGFLRQEYCSGLPFPSPGYLPNPGIEPGSSALQADFLSYEPPGKPRAHLEKETKVEARFRTAGRLPLLGERVHIYLHLWPRSVA